MRTSPTYKEIHAKIKELFFADPARYGGGKGPNVKDCYIAHMKDLVGVKDKRRREKFSKREHSCPESKRPLVLDAFIALDIPLTGHPGDAVTHRVTLICQEDGAMYGFDEMPCFELGHIADAMSKLAIYPEFAIKDVPPLACSPNLLKVIKQAFDELDVPYTG